MGRSPCTFKQQDVTRAFRAAFAAGATRAEIKVGPIAIVAEKAPDSQIVRNVGENEWDVAPAGIRKQ
jgi:hypothetical protein